MKKYSLNIAGYIISFESQGSGPDLVPSQRFLRNVSTVSVSDVHITVHSESFVLPETAERVFHAPLVEEINGVAVKTSDNFWSIYKHRSDLFIRTIYPRSNCEKEGTLMFSLTSRKWDLYIKEAEEALDPLEYPMDGLILYYLTVIHGDIFIHASGVNHYGHGYLFSGISGKGKTTIAGLWDKAGAKVIHDDRLIIRNIKGKYKMFNTPVYNDDVPSESPLNRVFLIEHGSNNKLVSVAGAGAVSLVLANCIQHNWSLDIIARIMGTLSMMCTEIPVSRLSFLPNNSIIDYILDYE
jgi:hypothetical protein